MICYFLLHSYARCSNALHALGLARAHNGHKHLPVRDAKPIVNLTEGGQQKSLFSLDLILKVARYILE